MSILYHDQLFYHFYSEICTISSKYLALLYQIPFFQIITEIQK
jgi:hypothetical protein